MDETVNFFPFPPKKNALEKKIRGSPSLPKTKPETIASLTDLGGGGIALLAKDCSICSETILTVIFLAKRPRLDGSRAAIRAKGRSEGVRAATDRVEIALDTQKAIDPFHPHEDETRFPTRMATNVRTQLEHETAWHRLGRYGIDFSQTIDS